MKSQVLHTVWAYISGEAAGEIWHWSLSGVTGLRRVKVFCSVKEKLRGGGGGGGGSWNAVTCDWPKLCGWAVVIGRIIISKGPFTHAIFDAISGAISRTKCALPYPARMFFFCEASRGLERKLSHIISRHPSFRFLLSWRYFVAELRDYKPVRGRLWQVLYAKSHGNRMKNRMCKRALTLSLPSSKSTFSKPFKEKMHK